jgi:ABC-type branched-subunit amino acid transport system ATPase component
MLSIARARHQPDLILLDEPLEGPGAQHRRRVEACIRRIMSESGTSLLLAEQHSGFALGVTS